MEEEKDTEWRDKYGSLLKQAKVAHAVGLFLHCLIKGESDKDAVETMCSRGRTITAEDIFSSMYEPIQDCVKLAEEYKKYS